MNKKLWLSTTAMALCGLATLTFAQSKGTVSPQWTAQYQQGGTRPQFRRGGPSPGMRMMRVQPSDLGSGYLKAKLGLSSEQASKIKKIESHLHAEMKKMGPPMGGPGMGGPGGPPMGGPGGPPMGGPGMGGPGMGGPPTGGPGMGGPGGPPMGGPMGRMFEQMRQIHQHANEEILGLLNSSQKEKLHSVLEHATKLQQAGIPAPTLGKLHLTESQINSLEGIGSKREYPWQAHEDAMKILTDEQKSVIQKFMKSHRPPMGPGMGGPGGGPGMGGPGMGGPGGGGPGGGGPGMGGPGGRPPFGGGPGGGGPGRGGPGSGN